MPDVPVMQAIVMFCSRQLPTALLPKDNELVTHWIEDATEEIQGRRRKTTMIEVDFPLLADTQVYDLPADCVQVHDLVVQGQELNPRRGIFQGFPLQAYAGQPYGMLPNGQRVTGSVDLIQRMDATRETREYSWRVEGTTLVLDRDLGEARNARLIYIARDRDPATLPKKYWELIATYVCFKACAMAILKASAEGDFNAEAMMRMNLEAIRKQKDDYEGEWKRKLSAISTEAD